MVDEHSLTDAVRSHQSSDLHLNVTGGRKPASTVGLDSGLAEHLPSQLGLRALLVTTADRVPHAVRSKNNPVVSCSSLISAYRSAAHWASCIAAPIESGQPP